MRFLFRSLLALLAVAAAAYSCLLGWAASEVRIGTAASTESAVRFVPYNAEYLSALAGAKPADAAALRKRSLELNPFNSEAWIQLGLHIEFQSGNTAEAERCYQRAASVDAGYLPRWTLAGYYFRRHDAGQFFPWAARALALSPYPATALLMEAYGLTPDDQAVIRILPERESVWFDYLNFLLASQRDLPLASVAKRAAAFPSKPPSDRPYIFPDWVNLLGLAEDRLLALNRPEPALELASALHRNGWTTLRAPSAVTPLSNANFAAPPSSHGFDWFSLPSNGVTTEPLSTSQSVRITFSGTQPEQCRLLQQTLPLTPGRSYRLEWSAESSDWDRPVGLAWSLFARHADGPDFESQQLSPDLFAKPSRPWEFTAPLDTKLCLLTLQFRRPSGQVRAEGSFTLHGLSLVPVGSPTAKGST